MTEGDTEVRRKETRQCDGRRRWGAAHGNSEVRREGFAWKYCGGRRGGTVEGTDAEAEAGSDEEADTNAGAGMRTQTWT